MIIVDGGIGSLVACYAEGVLRAGVGADRPENQPVGWVPAATVTDAAPTSRGRAIQRTAELCRLREVASEVADAGTEQGPAGLRTSVMLVRAASFAAERGISRVVWPVHAGGEETEPRDLRVIADACDRALLAGELASLDGGGDVGVKIEVPYADFSDDQLVDLASDMGIPLGVAWWCKMEGQKPCGECPACRRWSGAQSRALPVRVKLTGKGYLDAGSSPTRA